MLRVAHILILVDPAADNPALDHALRWAAAYDATVHALAVHMTEGDALPNVPPAIRPSEPVRDVVRSHSEGEYASLTVHSRCVTAATVVRGLSQYTDRHAVDLVVVPPGPDEWASSGVSPRQLAQLVDQTACPVFLARPASAAAAPRRPMRLLAPVDLSRHAEGMLDCTAQVAALYSASLDVLHVMERPPYVALNTVDMLSLSDATLPERRSERRLRALLDGCQTPLGETHIHVKHGEPASTIDAFARSRRSDLVVLPTHGTSRPSQRPMGTVASKLARRLDTSLLLIPSHAVSEVPSPPPSADSNERTSAS